MERAFGRVLNSKLVILESNWDVQEIYKENEPNSFVTKFFDPLMLRVRGKWQSVKLVIHCIYKIQ